jgi:hypothetical protein
MIKNSEMVKDFEDEFIKNQGKLSYGQSMKLFTAMWHEAVTLGVFPPKEPLEGIEADLKIAKVLNSCLKKSFPG